MSLFAKTHNIYPKSALGYQKVHNYGGRNSSSSDERTAYSTDDNNSNDGLDKEFPLSSKKSLWRCYHRFIVAHLVLFGLYGVVLFLVATHRPKDLRSQGMPFSQCPIIVLTIFCYVVWLDANSGESLAPAVEALQWEEHTFTLEDRVQERGSFSGKPNPSLDKAWHDLLNGKLMKR